MKNNGILKLGFYIILMIFSIHTINAQSLVSKDGSRGYVYDSLLFNGVIYAPVSKAKKIPSGKSLQFIDFVKLKEGFYYDAYKVRYKKTIYIIPHTSVADNSILELKNRELDSIKTELYRIMDSTKTAYFDAAKNYQINKEKRIKAYNKQIDSLEKLLPPLLKIANTYADSMVQVEKLKLEDQYKKEREKVEKSFPSRLRSLTKKIIITENKLEEPNYAGGCDYSFVYRNISGKTIKYLTWYVNVYNAVDDPVYCEISNTNFVSGKDTGPYHDGDKYCGGRWSCIIYNYSARKVILDYISIDYMDGTRSAFDLQKGDWERLKAYPVAIDAVENNYLNRLKQVNKYNYLVKKQAELGITWINTQKGFLKAKVKEDTYADSDAFLRECADNALSAKKIYEHFMKTQEIIELTKKNDETTSKNITTQEFFR